MRAEPGDWIAVDWGTSRMRAALVAADGEVRERAEPGPGMGSLKPHEFEPALLQAIHEWLGTEPMEVLVCGMAGARQGWREAPYVEVPASLTALLDGAVRVETKDRRIRVRIVPGLCVRDPAPDVMRGEETQLSGLLTTLGIADATVCLPGTHAKWARIENGRVVSFSTVMTGELHALLREHSILRHSVGTLRGDAAMAPFDSAVRQAIASKGAVLPLLFGIRAASLLNDEDPDRNASRLSGLLVGADVATSLGAAAEVHLIGSSELTKLYARAIHLAGATAHIHDGNALAVAGFHAMRVWRRDAERGVREWEGA